jgi:hypothetical protein
LDPKYEHSVEASKRRERLVKLKALRYLITICAWCKKVRYRKGVWQYPQAELQTQEGVKVSHGICPECSERVRPLH